MLKKENNVYYQLNSNYCEIINELIKKYPTAYVNQLKSKKFSNIFNWINECLPLLTDSKYSISTKCYWILNGLIDFPKCKICNNFENYMFKNVVISQGYKKTCCRQCATKDPERQNKVKQTCLKKYGVENVYQSKIVKEKIKSTLLLNYGVDHPSKSNELKLRAKNKCKILYNNENFNNRQKAKNTCLEKYGVENPRQTKNVSEKIKKTCLEKYGVECHLSNSDIKKQKEKTCLNKYGVKSFLASDKNILDIKQNAYKNLLNNNDDIPLFSFEEYCKRTSDKQLFKFKCKKCGNIFLSAHHDGYHNKCPTCYPHIRSNIQTDIVCFLKKYDNIIENNRSIIPPLELDIYIPEKKLAIEFDGLYWHSDELGISKNYHLNKTLECEKQGIQLIHIFENEWLTKQDIVKSRLKNLLGIYDKTVYARKCEIKIVDSKTSKEFQDTNHIQGSVNAKVNLGLYFEDELISLMTFGKCRFDKKHEWELLRFCNKLGYHIPGGASRLLKYFERTYNPKSLVSYADRRWSQGKVYEKLGFTLSHASAPNYWYWKNLKLESRVKYQKHKLKNLLEKFDPNKTEVENMQDNGYHRIFDCGNLVFEKLV